MKSVEFDVSSIIEKLDYDVGYKKHLNSYTSDRDIYTLSNEELQNVLDSMFDDFYKYYTFIMRKKRNNVLFILLTHKDLFLTLKNHSKFLVIIFMHQIANHDFASPTYVIDAYLNKHFKIDYNKHTNNVAELCYIQFKAILDRYSGQNTLALQKLEYVQNKLRQQDKNIQAMNYYILSMAYITSGKLSKAVYTCNEAKRILLETSNYIRYLYNQMTYAKVLSALGDYEDAISIYRVCLEGAIALNDNVQTNILEYLSTNIMYTKNYSEVISTLNLINRDKISNNAAYLYAYSYLQLGDKGKCKEWIEIGKNALFFHQSAANYLVLIEKMIDGNSNDILNFLKDFQKTEKNTEFYSSYKFLTEILIEYLMEFKKYKRACVYARELLNF